MAYKINGKAYTEHALMDEVVYNCKLILDKIIIKNEEVALSLETAESLENSDMFLAIMNGSVSINFFPLTRELLISHGFNRAQAVQYLQDRSSLPEYVLCRLKKYENIDRPSQWNPYEARFEYADGTIAGININAAVYPDKENGIWIDADGMEVDTSGDDVFIIGYTVPYYTDPDGTLLFYDEEHDYQYRDVTGKVITSTHISCIPGLFKEFVNDYYEKEQNQYYLSLYGRPPYGTHQYDVYVDQKKYLKQLKLDNGNAKFDFSLPIHKYTTTQINTLDSLGILDDIIQTYYYSDAEDRLMYKYLLFLGSNRIDLYKARKASDWDILYMPAVEQLVSDRFKELYIKNRDI